MYISEDQPFGTGEALAALSLQSKEQDLPSSDADAIGLLNLPDETLAAIFANLEYDSVEASALQLVCKRFLRVVAEHVYIGSQLALKRSEKNIYGKKKKNVDVLRAVVKGSFSMATIKEMKKLTLADPKNSFLAFCDSIPWERITTIEIKTVRSKKFRKRLDLPDSYFFRRLEACRNLTQVVFDSVRHQFFTESLMAALTSRPLGFTYKNIDYSTTVFEEEQHVIRLCKSAKRISLEVKYCRGHTERFLLNLLEATKNNVEYLKITFRGIRDDSSRPLIDPQGTCKIYAPRLWYLSVVSAARGTELFEVLPLIIDAPMKVLITSARTLLQLNRVIPSLINPVLEECKLACFLDIRLSAALVQRFTRCTRLNALEIEHDICDDLRGNIFTDNFSENIEQLFDAITGSTVPLRTITIRRCSVKIFPSLKRLIASRNLISSASLNDAQDHGKDQLALPRIDTVTICSCFYDDTEETLQKEGSEFLKENVRTLNCSIDRITRQETAQILAYLQTQIETRGRTELHPW